MIPPLAPGQTNEQQNMVGWKNTFNMRQVTLMNLAAGQIGSKNGLRNDLKNYIKNDGMAGPAKSLDILRRNLQSAINKDIDHIIRKYLDKFFQPAVKNIRTNLGKDTVTEDHIKVVCRQMLEDAKIMYKSYTVSRDGSPFEGSDNELSLDNRIGLPKNSRKRKESDTDSETGANYKRQKFRNTYLSENQVLKLPQKREGPKWDSERITPNTLFIMGARANKALGYAQTRGRLYVRHPELVRYSGDPEDKEWLASRNLMPPSGGKAYLMILDDIRELTQLDDYKNNSNLQINELVGFEAPGFLVNKVKCFMEQVRTDKKCSLDLFDFHSQSMTPPMDSAPSTPSDTMQMLESQSVSTSSSKHSIDGYIHIPEISPGSNNSMLAPSPLPTNSSLLSPNMLMNIAHSDNGGAIMVLPENTQNGTSLSSLLASASDNSQEF